MTCTLTAYYEAKNTAKSMKIVLLLYQLFYSRPFSIIQDFTAH